jgi:hypothetical protein
MRSLQEAHRFGNRQVGGGSVALLILLLAAMSGCSSDLTREGNTGRADGGKLQIERGKVDPGELEGLNRAFADRYVMRLATACDLMMDGNADDAQCRELREIRAAGAMTVYDIVTDPDPYLQTFNLAVVATLQGIIWDEQGAARKSFGERAEPLISCARTARAEVWETAARLFSPAELETLDELIRDWQRHNSSVLHLSHVRFTDFLHSAEATQEVRAKARGLFAEVERARQTLDVTRALAERSLYLGKRMPLVLAWRAQATVDQLGATAEGTRVLGDLHALAGAAERMPGTLDAQRKAIAADLDQRQAAVDATVRNMRETLAEADKFSTDAQAALVELENVLSMVQEVMQQGDALVGRYSSTPPERLAVSAATTEPSLQVRGRPFDIKDYTAALKEAGLAAKDLDAVLVRSGSLLESPAWQQRIAEINAAADGRVRLAAEQSQWLVTSIFRWVFIALGGLLIVLVLSRLLTAWILKKAGFSGHW